MELLLKLLGLVIAVWAFSGLAYGICWLVFPYLGLTFVQAFVVTSILVLVTNIMNEMVEHYGKEDDE
jgi:Na+-transporting methylmalonyl-CoA/oxaloacetate decarboxylase gamma subunit